MELIAFDFDGTLSTSEMTVLLGEKKGVENEIDEITKKAMNDEIDYAESLRKRVKLLQGLNKSQVKESFNKITLRPGTSEIIRSLRRSDIYLAIITGGFKRGVETILKKEGISVDRIVANFLTIKDGKLTGEVQGPLIEGTKDKILKKITKEEGIDISETIAVGDGANDLPMLKISGFSIGYQPKSAVKPHCDKIVNKMEELETVLREKKII